MHSKNLFSLSPDAKGIKIGGFKVPKPPVSVPKPISIPKPKIPVIVPVPIILPVGGFGRNYYVNRNSSKFGLLLIVSGSISIKIIVLLNQGLQCYSCEGSDNELCAVSPATSSKKVTCAEKNMFCSVIRKEVPIGIYFK